MVGDVTPYGLVLVVLVAVGGVIAIGLARVAWRHRDDVPGARTYTAVVAAAGIWCLTYVCLLVSPPNLARAVFDPLMTVAAVTMPFLWLLFTFEYTGRTEWLTRRRVALVLAEPALYLAVYVTDPLHGLLFDGPPPANEWQGLTLLAPRLPVPALVQVGIIYTVMLVGIGLLVGFILRTRNVHRRQATAILVGPMVTTTGNVLFIAGMSIHEALDLTPVFYVANGIIIGWALFHYDFLDVAPLVRDVLVEAMADPVIVLDDDGVLLDYNPAASRILGVGDGSMGEAVAERLQGVREAIATDGTVTLSTTDGDEAVFDPRSTPLTDQYGIERGQLVVLRDVTLLKRREETLSALQSATRDLMRATDEETVADVVVTAVVDVLDHRFAGYFTCDEECERLRSITLTDPVERAVPDGEMVYGSDDDLVWETFQRGEVEVVDVLQNGAGEGYEDVPLSSAVLLPLGDHGLVGVGSTEPRAYSDEAVRFLTILASAAESALDRLARERQLREHRDALEERNDRLEDFTSIVSHDLRTPLAAATGYLGLARETTEGGEEYLQRVADAHERMDGLIEDLLALARRGEDVDDPEPVAVEGVALEAWETAGHAEADIEIESFPAPVVADRERLRTLFENLLGNAVEHAGPDVSVTVGPLSPSAIADGEGAGDGGAAGEPEGLAGFYVADDGPGIPESERDDVFEQGYSGDGGMGLGLAIVKGIADGHGWEVTVTESDSGGAPVRLARGDAADEESDGSPERCSGCVSDERSESEARQGERAGGARFEFTGVETDR